MNRWTLVYLSLAAAAASVFAAGAAPTDNPVATYYGPKQGYPAWTARIRWDNVVDMSRYTKGKTNFEKFENARDELAAKGGGVLYYPAGTYDFSEGPFDGSKGRGLMLRSGIVIRGEAPAGKPKATDGALNLRTKFVFGTRKAPDAIDVGECVSLLLKGGLITPPDKGGKIGRHGLWLNLKTAKGKVASGTGSLYSKPLQGRVTGHKVTARVSKDGEKTIVDAVTEIKWKKEQAAAKDSYKLVLAPASEKEVQGTYKVTVDGKEYTGQVEGRLGSIDPLIPRDWNLVGLQPEAGKGVKDVNNVGVCWVHLDAGTIYMGPDMIWGRTWEEGKCWRSKYGKKAWRKRVPDGTHPFDPFMGAPMDDSGGFAGVGSGRLVFGCRITNACVLNDYDTCGRRNEPEGFGEDGYHMDRFVGRLVVYGSRVFVANNRLEKTEGRNFRHPQKTMRTTNVGAFGYKFLDGRANVVLFDYNKTTGIDVNKAVIGLMNGKLHAEGTRSRGYWEEGVAILGNYVYNHGGLGYSVSGKWCTIKDNRNERRYLSEHRDIYGGLGGWRQSLDGFRETAAGGGGEVMDNMSRGYEICGMNLCVSHNWFNNAGSNPGGDGEGIWWQPFAGTHFVSSSIVYNEWDKGEGKAGPVAAYDANVMGGLFAWNKAPWLVGLLVRRNRDFSDLAIIANKAAKAGTVDVAVVSDPAAPLKPPVKISAEPHADDAVKVSWRDAFDGEIGYRVDRSIEGGKWAAVAYRPPRKEKHELNEPTWIDFLAPPGQELRYRVATLNSKDDDSGASAPTAAITLGEAQEAKAAEAPAVAGNPGWRDGGSGAYPDANPPDTWSTNKNVKWSTDLPSWGNSSPIVVGDRVFVTCEPDVLICLDASNGKILWNASNDVRELLDEKERANYKLPVTDKLSGYSSSTPTSDGEHVYAIFGQGVVAAYTMAGKRAWMVRVELPEDKHGYASSPLLIGDTLIVYKQDIVGLNKTDGTVKWETKGLPRNSYGSPIHMKFAGMDLVVTPRSQIVRASDGKEIIHELCYGMRASSPVVHDNKIFFVTRMVWACELAVGENGAIMGKPTWQTPKDIFSQNDFSTALYHEGLIYKLDGQRNLKVLEADSGKVVYGTRPKLGRGRQLASPALAGNRIFIGDAKGASVWLKPGRKFEASEVSTLAPTLATPTFDGKRMFVRTSKRVWCVAE